jgi:anion-transporting  ArsA/GET3 family ATPase
MRIRIFVGTGGVGKTSVAAADALRAALGGSRCLVLTIDPALRLRRALGLGPGGIQQRVPLAGYQGPGELWAGLMDVRSTLDRAVRLYGQPKQAETVLEHPVYQILIESLAGMQELLAIERIDQALSEGFDRLFIDTAPSRHAFEFLDKPEFFAQLAAFPLVRLASQTYRWWEKSAISRLSRKSLDFYTRIEENLGTTMVREVLDFYAVFRTIAEGYAERARRTATLLHEPETTTFTIVTTAAKAARDGEHLWGELRRRQFAAESMIVNRLWPDLDADLPADAPREARDYLAWYRDVGAAQKRFWDQVSNQFSGRILSIFGLPELPRDIDGLPALYQIADNLETAARKR